MPVLNMQFSTPTLRTEPQNSSYNESIAEQQEEVSHILDAAKHMHFSARKVSTLDASAEGAEFEVTFDS